MLASRCPGWDVCGRALEVECCCCGGGEVITESSRFIRVSFVVETLNDLAGSAPNKKLIRVSKLPIRWSEKSGDGGCNSPSAGRDNRKVCAPKALQREPEAFARGNRRAYQHNYYSPRSSMAARPVLLAQDPGSYRPSWRESWVRQTRKDVRR